MMAGHFLLSTAVLALFALLEVGNFYLFQLGVLAVMVIVSILCGYFVL